MRSKPEIEAILQESFSDPGSEESGEYLLEHVLRDARMLTHEDRPGLVGVLGDWIRIRSRPWTTLALRVVGELKLTELRTDIQRLREDVLAGTAFTHNYLSIIDMALSDLAG